MDETKNDITLTPAVSKSRQARQKRKELPFSHLSLKDSFCIFHDRVSRFRSLFSQKQLCVSKNEKENDNEKRYFTSKAAVGFQVCHDASEG